MLTDIYFAVKRKYALAAKWIRRNMTRTGKQRVAGYFTVEATLLMGMILPLLVSIIIMGFYVHDNASLQCAASQIAAMGSNLREYDDRQNMVSRRMDALANGVTMWSGQVSGSVSLEEKAVSASCSGSFTFPKIMSLFGRSETVVQEKSWSRKIHKPASLIRKVRGVKGLADVLMKRD